MKNKLLNFLMLSKESKVWFKTYRTEIIRENYNVLWATSGLLSLMCLALYFSTLLDSAVDAGRSILYMIMFCISAIIWLYTQFYLRTHKRSALKVAYLFVGVVYVYAIILGVFITKDEVFLTICVLLFCIPLLLMDKIWRMGLYQLFWTSLIVFLTARYHRPDIAYMNICDSIICCIFGMVLSNYINRLRIENYAAKMADYQIRPHMITNVISSIQVMCRKDPKEAEQALCVFADYLRNSMYDPNMQGMIRFEKEMEHVRSFIMVEQIRFKERLRVLYDLEVKDFEIPSLTVQPMAENAIKHGILRRREGGTLTIASREYPAFYEVSITDDGIGFDTTEKPLGERQHVGIENVRQRLSILCGGSLRINSVIGEGTNVILQIPKKTVKKH